MKRTAPSLLLIKTRNNNSERVKTRYNNIYTTYISEMYFPFRRDHQVSLLGGE